jgi:hypothetical protein
MSRQVILNLNEEKVMENVKVTLMQNGSGQTMVFDGKKEFGFTATLDSTDVHGNDASVKSMFYGNSMSKLRLSMSGAISAPCHRNLLKAFSKAEHKVQGGIQFNCVQGITI